MRELIEMLGFWIDRSGATAVLREVDGGCHPATRIELALWDALESAREDAAEAKQNGYELGLLAGEQEAERLRGVIARYERKLDAAIDQARGKGGGEVGP